MKVVILICLSINWYIIIIVFVFIFILLHCDVRCYYSSYIKMSFKITGFGSVFMGVKVGICEAFCVYKIIINNNFVYDNLEYSSVLLK